VTIHVPRRKETPSGLLLRSTARQRKERSPSPIFLGLSLHGWRRWDLNLTQSGERPER
jgi:hypothetical protein